MKNKFQIVIETFHADDVGDSENVSFSWGYCLLYVLGGAVHLDCVGASPLESRIHEGQFYHLYREYACCR